MGIGISLRGLLDLILLALAFLFAFIGVLAAISHVVERISFLPEQLKDIISSKEESFTGTYVMGKGLLVVIPPQRLKIYDTKDMLISLTEYYGLDYHEALKCVSKGCVIFIKTYTDYFMKGNKICKYGFLTKICMWWGDFSVVKSLSNPLDIYDKEVYFLDDYNAKMTFYYVYTNGTIKIKIKKENYEVKIV